MITNPQETECSNCGLSFAHEHAEGSLPKDFIRVKCKHGNWSTDNCLGCYNEMINRQFVPDTIEVPVQWLKELVLLTMQFQNQMNSPRQGGRWATLQKLYDHIDLIREKL
jgi:hypothetical protein